MGCSSVCDFSRALSVRSRLRNFAAMKLSTLATQADGSAMHYAVTLVFWCHFSVLVAFFHRTLLQLLRASDFLQLADFSGVALKIASGVPGMNMLPEGSPASSFQRTRSRCCSLKSLRLVAPNGKLVIGIEMDAPLL